MKIIADLTYYVEAKCPHCNSTHNYDIPAKDLDAYKKGIITMCRGCGATLKLYVCVQVRTSKT